MAEDKEEARRKAAFLKRAEELYERMMHHDQEQMVSSSSPSTGEMTSKRSDLLLPSPTRTEHSNIKAVLQLSPGSSWTTFSKRPSLETL